MPAPILAGLLGANVVPRALKEILQSVLSGGNVNLEGKLKDLLQDKLEAQSGRGGARMLSRALLETVDATLEEAAGSLTLAQRREIADELTKNAALQLAQAAELLMAYPALQEAVVAAKQSGVSAAELEQARVARNAHAEKVKQALIDVGRVAAGDSPRE